MSASDCISDRAYDEIHTLLISRVKSRLDHAMPPSMGLEYLGLLAEHSFRGWVGVWPTVMMTNVVGMRSVTSEPIQVL